MPAPVWVWVIISASAVLALLLALGWHRRGTSHSLGGSAGDPTTGEGSIMPQFDFRLRFHLDEGTRLACDEEQLVVYEDEVGRRIRLKSGEKGKGIREVSRHALIGGPYRSEGEARQAADAAKRALLIWAVKVGAGVDPGDGKFRGGFTNEFLMHLAKRANAHARRDVHGIDVYPHEDPIVFAGFEASACAMKNPSTFTQAVDDQMRDPVPLSEKQALACEVFCSSFFDVSTRSRFITLMSAVEALLVPREKGQKAKDLVDSFLTQVDGADDIDEATRTSMTRSLERLRRESIGQAGRALCKLFLQGREYMGKPASRFFTDCYAQRSQIVHGGQPRDAGTDVSRIASAFTTFVQDLLLASLGSGDLDAGHDDEPRDQSRQSS